MTRSPLAEWPLPAFQLNNNFAVVDQSLEAEQLFGKPKTFFEVLDEGSRPKAERWLKQSDSKKPVELNFITAAGFFLADVHYRWDSDFLLNLVLVPSSPLLQAQQKSQNKVQKETAPMKLKVGDTAPDFTLLAFDGKDLKKVSLQDYKGKKNVALAFFVFAFTGG